MYTEYFGFQELPFSVTPDPRFLYYNDCYQEAIAALGYGIEGRKGFVSLIGEAGTGKTTLLRNALDTLDPQVRTVLLLHPTVSFDEILEHVLQELGIPTEGARKLVRLQRLNEFLLEHTRNGGNVALLVDEAQDLAPAVLEELRLLSNLETGREKILQIVLAGQPELESHLSNPALRQLRQRIALHIRIRPLTPPEVAAYVRSRIERAGAGRVDIFRPDALERIAAASHGIPRIVNVLCDAALMSAVANGVRQVTGPMIDEAWTDHGGHAGPLSPITVLGGGGAVSGAAAEPASAGPPDRPGTPTPVPPPAPVTSAPVTVIERQVGGVDRRRLLWGAAGVGVAGLLLWLTLGGSRSPDEPDGVWPEDRREEVPATTLVPPPPSTLVEAPPTTVATTLPPPLAASVPPPTTAPGQATVAVVAPTPTAAGAPSGVEAVKVVEAFRSAYEARDVERLSELFTDDIRSGQYRGRPAVAESYRQVFAEWADIELAMPTLRVLPRGEKTAIDAPFTTRFRRRNGTRGYRRGWTEFVLVRTDAGVRITAISSREQSTPGREEQPAVREEQPAAREEQPTTREPQPTSSRRRRRPEPSSPPEPTAPDGELEFEAGQEGGPELGPEIDAEP